MTQIQDTKIGNYILEKPSLTSTIGEYIWHVGITGPLEGGIEGALGSLSLPTWYHCKKIALENKIKEVFDPSTDESYSERVGEIFHHMTATVTAIATLYSIYSFAITEAIKAFDPLATPPERINHLAPLGGLLLTNLIIPHVLHYDSDERPAVINYGQAEKLETD
ncbi:MAG: hypothetical protein HGA85_07785 [Nanoarchaeota archaeon]|nr:hypothetical protein [Nanoarchaeota archaeon]